MAAWRVLAKRYHGAMDKDEHLQRHLDLCQRIYLRMLEDGSWPWSAGKDSTDSEGMVESEDSNTDV